MLGTEPRLDKHYSPLHLPSCIYMNTWGSCTGLSRLPGWFSGKESCQLRIPWRRKWQPTLLSLPGRSHAQRGLLGCSPQGHRRLGHGWVTGQRQLGLLLALWFACASLRLLASPLPAWLLFDSRLPHGLLDCPFSLLACASLWSGSPCPSRRALLSLLWTH